MTFLDPVRIAETQRLAAIEILRRRQARDDLLAFTQYTNPRYAVAAVHRLIAAKLMAVALGQITRLMIFCPPRHGKSELASVRFPAWYLGKFPEREIISASYGSDLADDFGRQVRNLVDSDEYAVLFDTRLAADSQRKDRWHTSKQGGYVAAGIGGGHGGTSITGRGANILNLDDPIKGRAEAESEAVREAVWKWYKSDAYTRLMPGGGIVLTLTRWHEDDLAGRLLAAQEDGGDKWEIVNLAAFAEPNDALGRKVGEPLWPERYGASDLERIKHVLGEYDWQALYQQNPRPPGGGFFDEKDFLAADGKPYPLPRTCASVFAVVDSAAKTGKLNDGTGVTFYAYENLQVATPLLILDYDLVQIEGDLLIKWLPGIFELLEAFAAKCNARMGSLGVYIEDKSSGMILLQAAGRLNYPVEPIDSRLTSVGKAERAISVSGYVRQKLVGFCVAAYERTVTYKGVTKNHLLSQILRFFVGTKDMGQDDLLDTFTYGVALSLGNGEGF